MTTRRLKGSELIRFKLAANNDDTYSPYTDSHVNPYILKQVERLIASYSANRQVRIIEFGARAGALGRVLSTRWQNITYLGVEPYPPIQSAYNIYQDTCESFIISPLGSRLTKNVNILIFADVLEHLDDPWQYLQDLHKCCSSSTYLVASVPNFFHHSALKLISEGRFDYEEWGVLDITHKRFFGYDNILEMFELTNWKINVNDVDAAIDPEGFTILNSFKDCKLLPKTYRFGNFSISLESYDDAIRLAAYQYILTAERFAN